MTPAPEGTATPEGTSATPLENDLASMFGDFTSGGESPESDETSDAGTPPATPSAETEKTPDGKADPDPATAKPSEGITPDAAPVVDDDPLAATSPATYVVNGQTRTSDDIRVFKEGGAVIVAEALPNVLSKLAQLEQVTEKARARDTDYQTLSKATEWTDQDGKSYTGPEAAMQMRIGNAGLFAENQLIVRNVLQAEDLQSLLTTKDVADGKGGVRQVVVFRPEVIEDLQRENALQQREITASIRDHYKTALAAQPAPTSIDYTTEAPKLIQAIAEQAKLDASVLTAADRSILAKHLPRHVEKGQASLEWQELVKDRLQDRAKQKADATAIASTTEKATKEAQARMAAAARGVKPATRPAVAAPKPKPPTEERLDDEGALFDSILSSGAKAMRAAG